MGGLGGGEGAGGAAGGLNALQRNHRATPTPVAANSNIRIFFALPLVKTPLVFFALLPNAVYLGLPAAAMPEATCQLSIVNRPVQRNGFLRTCLKLRKNLAHSVGPHYQWTHLTEICAALMLYGKRDGKRDGTLSGCRAPGTHGGSLPWNGFRR